MSFSFNPLSIVAGAVESACHAILPKELAFVGDLAGLASDVQSGNVLKGVDDIRDLTQDLAQQLSGQGAPPKKSAEANSANSDSAPQTSEPNPPPPYCRTGFGAPSPVSSTGLDAPAVRGASPGKPSTPGQPVAPDTVSTTKADATPPTLTTSSTMTPIPFSANHIGKSTTIVLPTGTTSPNTSGTTPADRADSTKAAGATPASDSSQSPAVTRSTAAVDSSVATDSSGAATSSSSSTTATNEPTTADGFFKLSDKDLMNAVRDGKIPDSVSKDPEQMRRLQMRMNDIAEMNQLITTMLSTLHDLNKQIIQNLHV